MTNTISLGIILSVCVTAVSAGAYCYPDYITTEWDENKAFWCSDGCCGSIYGQYCCSVNEGGAIVLMVIGGLMLLLVAATIGVIIFCCCRKTTGRPGQVLQPSSVAVPVTVYGAQAFGAGQVAYNGTIQTQIATSNVPPGTTQYLQQPPPSYDQLAPN